MAGSGGVRGEPRIRTTVLAILVVCGMLVGMGSGRLDESIPKGEHDLEVKDWRFVFSDHPREIPAGEQIPIILTSKVTTNMCGKGYFDMSTLDAEHVVLRLSSSPSTDILRVVGASPYQDVYETSDIGTLLFYFMALKPGDYTISAEGISWNGTQLVCASGTYLPNKPHTYWRAESDYYYPFHGTPTSSTQIRVVEPISIQGGAQWQVQSRLNVTVNPLWVKPGEPSEIQVYALDGQGKQVEAIVHVTASGGTVEFPTLHTWTADKQQKTFTRFSAQEEGIYTITLTAEPWDPENPPAPVQVTVTVSKSEPLLEQQDRGGRFDLIGLILSIPGQIISSVTGIFVTQGTGCPDSQTSCQGVCSDITSDESNCGACGNLCPPDFACQNSQCVSLHEVLCGTGSTYCPSEGVCRDLTVDESNCGACGNVCPANYGCQESRCVSLHEMLCGTGSTYCPSQGVCRDLKSDPENCGGCELACGAEEACLEGKCTPVGDLICGTGSTYCPSQGVCADLASNSYNCGSCGNVCVPGQTCQNGACTVGIALFCLPGQMLCGNLCVYPDTDPTNCGGCGNHCPANTVCMNGMCEGIPLTCPQGQLSCNGICTDVLSNDENCGGCGNTCTGRYFCMNGACILPSLTCPGGLSSCGGTCVDNMTDPNNCGACGNTCRYGLTCQNGICAGSPGCPEGETLCSGTCVNMASDWSNCGACGNTCGLTEMCSRGACVARGGR